MALRGYGFQAITALTPVPVFGTTLTAAFRVSPDQHTGNTAPGSQPSWVVASVANPYFFRVGDKCNVGPGAAFELPGIATAQFDTGKIVAVNYTASTVTIQGLTANHAAGEFLILSADISGFNIQAGTANGGTVYIGEDFTVSATSKTLLAYLTTMGDLSWGVSNSSNVLGTSHMWIAGTNTGDTYLANINLV